MILVTDKAAIEDIENAFRDCKEVASCESAILLVDKFSASNLNFVFHTAKFRRS